MTSQTTKSILAANLHTVVRELEALGSGITGDQATKILARCDVRIDDVTAFITRKPDGYSRRRVARTENFEVLVMTWLPGQASVPHDHAGSVSAFKILCGTADETRYARAADSLVDPTGTRQLHRGDVGLDADDDILSVRNDPAGSGLLVSLHVYAPPIRELRRFTLRAEGRAPADAFQRPRAPGAPVVAIVGGGYSGTVVAVQLVQKAAGSGTPLHLIILDRQPSIAEGAAYRTPDARHLLNVPASGMSAWPDRPADFLEWARQRGLPAGPYSFLPRRIYGEYLRATFFDAIGQAGPQISVEIRREEADRVERGTAGGWRICAKESQPVDADILVMATGHRPPIDPLNSRWSGSRARYIEDPWSSLMLTAIEPDESVCLLGTGLTAVDVLQSLGGATRSARVTAFSRRGWFPTAHSPAALAPLDPRNWLEPFLRAGTAITTLALTRRIRCAVRAMDTGQDWRQVIDGLRPHISRIWAALPPGEKSRFLRHARAFWEVVRHRMSPTVAKEVREAAVGGKFITAAARILHACGDLDGATLSVRRRGESAHESLRFDWIVNCTGPGSARECGLLSSIAKLIDTRYLEDDPLGLVVRSSTSGQAIVDGQVVEDLLLIGTLRKAELWESTAVPELRQQAAQAADAIMQLINRPRTHSGDGRPRPPAMRRSSI